MLARVHTVAFQGIEVIDVDVQISIGAGMPAFLLVGLPGVLFSILALSIKEPPRQNLLRTREGAVSRLSLSDVLAQATLRWRSVAGICVGFAAQALCNYAQQAWLSTYFVRAHEWSIRQARTASAATP